MGEWRVGSVAGSSMDQAWNLNIQWEIQHSVAVVTVVGRIGTGSSGQLLEALIEIVKGGHRRLLVDLERVDYVSSAGLMTLDAAAGRVHESGGSMVLCGLCESVRLVFELSGLLAEFVVVPSRAEGFTRLRET